MTDLRRLSLKQKLAGDTIVIAPGIYDMVSVRIADRMGFDSLYMTGFGTVASYLGETIGKSFDLPLFVNIVEGGKTPQLPPDELQRLGFSLAIYPVAGLLAAAQAMENVFGEIKARRGTGGYATQLYPFAKVCTLMGFEAVWEFDRQHAD